MSEQPSFKVEFTLSYYDGSWVGLSGEKTRFDSIEEARERCDAMGPIYLFGKDPTKWMQRILNAETNEVVEHIHDFRNDERVKKMNAFLEPHIETLKGLLFDETREHWDVSVKHDDGVSFQFRYRLGDLQCESICWCMAKVANEFNSMGEFLSDIAKWPVKRWALWKKENE